MELLSERELNILRGKSLVNKITGKEALSILNHLAVLEAKMDEADCDDFFGTEGWRHYFGMPDAD